MGLNIDAAKEFQKVNVGLIPSDETILAVVQTVPKGESSRGVQEGDPPPPISYRGEAASWPNRTARQDSAPGRWSKDILWFFWVVVTDKRLHVFEGRMAMFRRNLRAGPEAARFELDRIEEIRLDRPDGFIWELAIRFKDGSRVELDVFGRQKLDALRAVIRPLEKPGSARPSRGGIAAALWLLGIPLLVLGMALSFGAPTEAREARLLAYRGVDTEATVTDVTIRGGGGGLSRHARVDVSLRDEFGLSAKAADVIYCGDYEAIRVGDTVAITYDPEGEARAQFTECPQSQEIAIPVMIGVVVLGAGTICVVLSWLKNGWRRRWAIPILILGILLVRASLEEECQCQDFIYTGASLVVTAAVPLATPRRRQVPSAQQPGM